MVKGDIVLVDFYFTDFSNFKQRPALIVSSKQSNSEDVILAFITSIVNSPIHPTHFLLSNNDEGFEASGLKANSIIKCDKLMTVNKKLIIGKIGTLNNYLKKEVDIKLLKALEIEVK